LYGGVADGGIDACNGGCCTAVGANTYFYTPDANTAAETLLAPPSVVFAAADDDAGEDNGAIADEDEAEPAADTATDVATFVERSAVEAGTTVVAVAAAVAANSDNDANDVLVTRNEEAVTEVITEATRTTAAPAGSVVALATARGFGSAQTAALNILINPTGTDAVPRAGFLDAATGETDSLTGDGLTTTALAAFDFDLVAAGCDPCLYATAGLQGTSATVEVTVDVFMGRWTGDALLLNSGVDLNALQNHHYAIALADGGIAISPNTPSLEEADRNLIGVFSLINSTSPTDADGNLGTLTRAGLVMDFHQQIVTSIELDISFADERAVFAREEYFPWLSFRGSCDCL